MRKFLGLTGVVLAIAGASIGTANAAETVAPATSIEKQAKWPRWAERSFINSCKPRVWKPLSCTEVLRAAESRYTVRQFIHLNNRQIHRFVASLY